MLISLPPLPPLCGARISGCSVYYVNGIHPWSRRRLRTAGVAAKSCAVNRFDKSGLISRVLGEGGRGACVCVRACNLCLLSGEFPLNRPHDASQASIFHRAAREGSRGDVRARARIRVYVCACVCSCVCLSFISECAAVCAASLYLGACALSGLLYGCEA